MFLTVQIRGPVQLVRRRTGEEVDNPIQEFEDGGSPLDFDSTFDMRHRVVDSMPTDLESLELPTELEVAGTAEKLVAATAAFSSQSDGHGRDLEKEQEIRRRAELDRPMELRRLLSQMHELSMLARPAKQTFIRHMQNGLARASLRVWRGVLTIGASVESFMGTASHLTRAGGPRGPGARLRGEGLLEPDGSINQLRLDVQLDALPTLGPLEQAEVDRLKRTFVQLHAEGLGHAQRETFAQAHYACAQRRPELPLMLLVALLNDLERQALGVLGDARPTGVNSARVTLHDVIEASDSDEALEEEVSTRLVWVDDRTPALDVPGCDVEQLAALNEAFRRLLDYLPAAWSRRSMPQAS